MLANTIDSMNMAGATSQTQQPNQFDELKEIVSKTLEKKGILAKAQAQLRKHVFEALSITEQENERNQNVSPPIDENDMNDKFAMALIRDFLSYHHLDYTLSLMNTESQKKLESTQNITRNEIATRLGLPAQKPNPDSSLLKQLVTKLFDNDVLKPRNSTITNDIKLKPRASNDSYRSTLDSASLSTNTIAFQQQNQSKNDHDRNIDNKNTKKYTNPLENLSFSLPTSSDLPPISSTKKAIKDIEDIEDEVDISILEDVENVDDKEKVSTIDDIIDESLEDLLNSSSNGGDQDENDGDENDGDENKTNENEEELKRIEQMNKTMEQLRQQTSEFEKLKKESISPSQSAISSQTVTEYEDDFGSDDNEDNEDNNDDDTNIDDSIIEEEIDEDIDEDIDDDDNIYSAKDQVNDKEITKDFKLENVADIIMNVKTEKIKFQL